MTADNWRECPKCGPATVTRQEKLQVAYGKVDHAEYIRLVAEAQDDAPTETLREDYEIGIWGGQLHVDYAASCTECGFSLAYKHEEAIR